jgi:hypothetical protein
VRKDPRGERGTREEGRGRWRERIGARGGRTRCRHKSSVYADNGDEVQQVQGQAGAEYLDSTLARQTSLAALNR